ncbi:MAG: hypothetical protein LBG06_08445 [Deltaproteobacteria bacterium]|jgi:hypothetical protein|nr:hypothetical protein [Deltaproteobacteria bacterium]
MKDDGGGGRESRLLRLAAVMGLLFLAADAGWTSWGYRSATAMEAFTPGPAPASGPVRFAIEEVRPEGGWFVISGWAAEPRQGSVWRKNTRIVAYDMGSGRYWALPTRPVKRADILSRFPPRLTGGEEAPLHQDELGFTALLDAGALEGRKAFRIFILYSVNDSEFFIDSGYIHV